MSDLLAARSQMAMSLAFHIVYAAIGIAMPLMMVLAEWRWIRTGESVYLDLAKRWAKGTAILFAVGAVSGTVLSFELGLLWPRFMAAVGAVIGPLFALEGFAFFTEAIFLGIYLYGWARLPVRLHLAAGVIVAVSGVASAVAVTTVNAWMNTPTGVEWEHGLPHSIQPWTVMTNPHALHQTIHMVLAAFAATGLFVAGIHAFMWLRGSRTALHRHALAIALLVGGPPALLQPLSGDVLARSVAEHQPAKLAAMEALFDTERGAAFRLGGIPDEARRTVDYVVELPRFLSVLIHLDPDATVTGLDQFPRQDWPPVAIVHGAFQVMVGAGMIMAGTAIWSAWRWKQGRLLNDRPLLWTLACAAPLGFLAIEAGWIVTEVGRQPWIVYGMMRTRDAVTPMPGMVVPFLLFTLLYGLLSLVVLWTMARHVGATQTTSRSTVEERLLPDAAKGARP
ncbi:cytochrome ubiquinol oxidase subunit I [Nitrospira sp.]|nr:cytochrome ubiquinol oxidase subunit I [Nitrospira sp.]